MNQKKDFSDISYDDFRRLAGDNTLSKYERVGFPNSYREGQEIAIYKDICSKLTNLGKEKQKVLDIGPGCSDLPTYLIDTCRSQNHELILIDSHEMLVHLPTEAFINKVNAKFPDCPDLFADHRNEIDVILCYSVLQYILPDTSFFKFLDSALSLLAPGGQLLIGDIPNISMRKRFFSSSTGEHFHQDFMKVDTLPEIKYNQIDFDQIDDATVFFLLQRARSAGFHAYVSPQNQNLPMANRREDILIVRP